MADLDADGNQDLITGCFEGGAYMMLGGPKGEFGAPEALLDKSGAILRVGQFWNDKTKKWDGVQGSRFKEFLGISAVPHDWDGDGDFDLLLGTNEGRVFLRINEGTADRAAFATESVALRAGGEDITVESGHSMPVAADWDGDGRFDLVSGSNEGSIYWFRNIGHEDKHEFAAPQKLVHANVGADDAPGRRTQVAVTDFDGDGHLDLLVGDYRSTGGRDKKRRYHGWVWLFARRAPKR